MTSLSSFWTAASYWSGRIDFTNRHQSSWLKQQPAAFQRQLVLSHSSEFNGVALTLDSPRYPPLLAALPYAPPVLFLRGNGELLDRSAIAIVGTRQCSQSGRRFTRALSTSISRHNCVVSGMAYGIDEEAHKAAPNKTIAVCGQGLDADFSGYRWRLASLILKGNGLLVSEFPAETTPKKWTYVQRNRVIAGLCEALVVVEAPLRSGALISAQFAVDYGRDVYAVPHHPHFRNGLGCLQLLRDGAQLCFGTEWGSSVSSIEGLSTEEIAGLWRETVATTQKRLTELSLNGRMYSQAGKWYILR